LTKNVKRVIIVIPLSDLYINKGLRVYRDKV